MLYGKLLNTIRKKRRAAHFDYGNFQLWSRRNGTTEVLFIGCPPSPNNKVDKKGKGRSGRGKEPDM